MADESQNMSTPSWRWAFYVNVPVVILGFAIAWRPVEETPRLTQEKVDWLGLALLTPGMAALVTAIVKGNNWGWQAPATLATTAAALVLLSVFIVIERRVASPIIDFKLLRHPQFLACCVLALTLGGFIALGSFMAPLYLQTVRNEIPYVAGLMLLPIFKHAFMVGYSGAMAYLLITCAFGAALVPLIAGKTASGA